MHLNTTTHARKLRKNLAIFVVLIVLFVILVADKYSFVLAVAPSVVLNGTSSANYSNQTTTKHAQDKLHSKQ